MNASVHGRSSVGTAAGVASGGAGEVGAADAAADAPACTVTLCQAGRCSEADSYELHFSEVALRCELSPTASDAARALLLASCQEAQRLQAALVEADRRAAEQAPAPKPQHKHMRGRSRGKRRNAAGR